MAGHTRTILAVRNISGAYAGATLIGEVIGDAFFGENSESSLFCSVLEFAEHEHYLLPRGRDLRELYTFTGASRDWTLEAYFANLDML